ncbi:MAG: hypothetical protein ACXV3U_07995 [Halobacteriota archaeon]
MVEICATFDEEMVAVIDELVNERPDDYPTRANAVKYLVGKALAENKELTRVTIEMLDYKTKVADLQTELESKDKQLSEALQVQYILANDIAEYLKRSTARQ